MKRIIIYGSLSMAAGLLLTNIYTSIVDAPNWGSNMPASIEAAREYYKTANPGNFFRIFSPLNQLLSLLALFLFWKAGRQVRIFLAIALLLNLIAEGMTFKYFYPRNDIMFFQPVTDWGQVRTAWQEWSTMNWVRSFSLAAGVISTSLALHASYMRKKEVSTNERKQEKKRIAVHA